MEWISGSEVDPDDIPDIVEQDEKQVYEQLAFVTTQLWKLRFDKIGPLYENDLGQTYVGPFVDEQGNSSGPFDTAVEYFKFKVAGIRTTFNDFLNKNPELSDSEKRRARTICSLYEKVASELSDHDYGTFPLTHGDLGTHNVLFERDEDGQLQINGVLDWDYAHASAWPDFGQFPTLLEIDWPSLEAGQYSSLALDSLRHQQKLYLCGVRKYEDTTRLDGYPLLSEIIDTAAVRVSEFILLYSNPRDEVDVPLLLKYIREWRRDWKDE